MRVKPCHVKRSGVGPLVPIQLFLYLFVKRSNGRALTDLLIHPSVLAPTFYLIWIYNLFLVSMFAFKAHDAVHSSWLVFHLFHPSGYLFALIPRFLDTSKHVLCIQIDISVYGAATGFGYIKPSFYVLCAFQCFSCLCCATSSFLEASVGGV